MARQRRTLDEQIAELVTRGRNTRTEGFSTPAMSAIGPAMILDNAILNEHLAEGAVELANLDDELKATLDSLAGNKISLSEATSRLEKEAQRIDSLFEEVNEMPDQVAAAKAAAIATAAADALNKANKALSDAKADAQTKADNALTYALAAAPRGDNVVVNGSFEQDFTGWDKEVTQSGGNYGIDTAVFRTGTRSFYSTKNGGFRQGPIPVKAGETWEFTLWFKTDDQYTSSNAGGLRLQAKGADGDTWKDVASTTLKASPADWTQSTLRYVVPAGTSQIRARFAFNYTGGAKVWVDDVALANVTAGIKAATDAQALASTAKAEAIAIAAADAKDKADKAQAAAVNAAAADATNKAEQAEANAAAAAASDAKQKAEEAAAAALTAAKSYADTQASGASGAALASAKLDAQDKANAAQAAAIKAAALDATAKKEAAEATAAADAKDKADKALAAAKVDAQNKANAAAAMAEAVAAADALEKANAAQAAATAAAAEDATAKANAAKAAAATDATTKMNNVANSKNATFYGTAVPTATSPKGTLAGDTYRRKSGNNIIGEYEWVITSGVGSWVQRKMTSASMTAVDVGVLSAGTAVVNEAVAQKIAAATASFQTADIGNLTVTGTTHLNEAVAQTLAADTATFIKLSVSNLVADKGTLDTAVINQLYSDVVESRKMKANQILIGEPGNMFPDPNFTDPAGWPSNGVNIIPQGGRNGNNGYQVPASTAQAGGYYGNTDRDRQFAVVPGATYYVSAWVKPDADVAAKQCSIYLKWTNPSTAVAGNFATPSTVGNDKPIKAGVWTEVSGQMTVPAEATRGFIGLYVQAASNVRAVFSEPSVQLATSAALVVNGAIKAGHLESDMVLSSRIVAGDKNGVRAEMSPDGFKVFTVGADGVASETVRMGVSSTNDMFAITDEQGVVKASIDQTGRISAPYISADNEFWYKGESFDEIQDRQPKGIVAMATRDTNSPTYDSGSERPYMHLTFPVEEGRLYKISTNGMAVDGDGSALIVMRWAENVRATTTGGIVLAKHYTAPSSMGSAWQSPATFNRGFRCWWTGTLSILISLRGIGSSKVKMLGDTGAYLNFIMVEDTGKLPSNTGESLDGNPVSSTVTPAAPPVRRTYEKVWTAEATRSYLPNGQPYNFNTTKMFQGLSPAGYGNLNSFASFPDMTAELSGATINSASIYLYFEHWYNNSGGTARIGMQKRGLPATFTGAPVAMTSSGWPKPGGRWVAIPSAYFAGLINGNNAAVTLNGDSSYGSYGYATNKPQIKINYTK